MPTAEVNGVSLFYDLAGPPDAPVIAFSNSLGCSLAMWDGVVPALAGRYRCLRYDMRGHGRSGSADVAITIDDLAADLAGLLDRLAIGSAHIVGLSLGGMTALAFAARYPERVKTVVTMASAAVLLPPDFWQKRAALVRTSGPEAVVDTILPRWFTAPFRAAAPEAVDRIRGMFLTVDRAGYARCCEAIAVMDLRDRLAQIAAPALVLVGAEDPVTPPALAEEVRSRIPGAELTVIADAAHLMAVERPDAVAGHLAAFIDRHEGRRADDDDDFQRGLAIRKAVLGGEYVERALVGAGPLAMAWQDFITRHAWNDVWGDPALPQKTRSLVTLAMMIALHREEEFRLHLRPALRNGVSAAELAALIRQAAAYAGIPAGNAAMRWARAELGDDFK